MIRYKVTNESLNAVTFGLDLNSEDVVLSIGGSGDQPFAMLEYAKEVRVLDYSRDQLGYIKKRHQHLIHGRFDLFLDVDKFGVCDDVFDGSISGEMAIYNLEKRNEYFSFPGRLEKIRENASKLVFLPNMVAEKYFDGKEKGITKAYFSNVREMMPSDVYNCIRLEKVVDTLPINGLIYLAIGRGAPWSFHLESNTNVPSGLILDKDLTDLARSFQIKRKWNMWIPAVFRVTEHRENFS